MPRVILFAAAAFFVTGAAQAAPSVLTPSWQASDSVVSTTEPTFRIPLSSPLIASVKLEASARVIATSPPEPQGDGSEECQLKQTASPKKPEEQEQTKLAKQAGPEPIYLAF